MDIQTMDIPVRHQTLRALRFGTGAHTVLAAHGISASAMSFRAVARHLRPEWSLLAVDLRGRGGSSHVPGPYGIDAHAADLCAVAESLGTPLTLTGQSMGAYAALRAAAARPHLFDRLILIDGGLPLPVPDDVDPGRLLAATIGPAARRLSQTFESVQAYLDFFRVHPALADAWNADVEEYVRYDTAGEPPHIRSRTNPDAFTADGTDLLLGADSFGEDLLDLKVPAHLLHAPAGMFGEPPGLLPQPVVDHWAARAENLTCELVPGTNHYTILLDDGAAALIAARLTQPMGR